MALVTIEEYQARQAEIKARLAELDTEFQGRAFPEAEKAEWNELNEEVTRNDEVIEELSARRDRIAALDGSSRHVEREPRGSFHTNAGMVPDDLHNLSGYREAVRTVDELPKAYTDGARRILETAVFMHDEADRARTQEHIDRILETDESGETAFRMIVTGSPVYRRAFGKALMERSLTTEESAALSRAASLSVGSGGYAVPFTLDPTLIPISNGVINPIRQLAAVRTITGNTWKGVTSTAVVASYDTEASEVSDDTPTLAQPSLTVSMARAFVPFSIEIGEDWSGFQTEMTRLFADAKDVLESSKFLTGTGTNEPEGLLVGATAVVSTAATALIAVGDIYALEEAVPARWRARSSFLANKAKYNKVRQFDTNGGANMWVTLGNGMPSRLLDYPTFESSDMSSSTASGASVITLGDFSQFVIADRVGMSVELIPHLFHTANNLPSGQRGLFAYWRNTSKVIVPAAFRTLKLL